MLYIKFEGYQPAGFGEDFKGVLPYMDMGAILVTGPGSWILFCPPSHLGSIWNLVGTALAVLEKMFEKCGRTTDGRTTEPVYTGSSHMSLNAQVS